MSRRLLPVLAATLVLAASNAHAGPCAPGTNPFSDISDNIFFCTNTLWLRNANVTLGCVSSGANLNYCPDEYVIRSQMALFMNRLARTLTPEIFFDTVSGPPQGDLDTDAFACRSPGVYTVTSPILQHFGLIYANLSLLTNADADIQVELQMSKNGSFFPINAGAMRLRVPANQWTMASVIASNRIQLGSGSLAINPGETFEFRVVMRRLPGSTTTGEVVDTRCQFKADMLTHWNQN